MLHGDAVGVDRTRSIDRRRLLTGGASTRTTRPTGAGRRGAAADSSRPSASRGSAYLRAARSAAALARGAGRTRHRPAVARRRRRSASYEQSDSHDDRTNTTQEAIHLRQIGSKSYAIQYPNGSGARDALPPERTAKRAG